jgi:hypothetical protein
MTRRGTGTSLFGGSTLGSRAASPVQHEPAAPSAYQSAVHSQTLPAMSYSPTPFGGKLPTGAARSWPPGLEFDERPGHEDRRVEPGRIVLGCGFSLCERHVARRGDELRELGVRHGAGVDRERPDRHLPHGSLLEA